MNELDRILASLPSTKDAVLTTVVHVKGSAYRRPGARMLICPDGRRIGSISGGCLEGDVCKKAWWFTEGGAASVRIYDTSSDEDAVWEFGLGCNGIVHVLFERADDRGTAEMLRFVGEARSQRKPVSVATVVGISSESDVRLGDRLLFDAQGIQGGAIAGSRIEADVLAHIREAYLRQKNHLAHLPECDAFIEWIGAPLSLVIFGAGHDAQPLVRFASELGWHVTVADGRANYATQARFPEARRLVVIDPGDPLRGIGITRDTAVVMMTHNYPQDVKLLRSIVPAKPRYLGILGPKSRTSNLLEEINLPFTGIDLHAPVGLDLGSDAPEAVALAIAAEIQAAVQSREGGMLKYRQKPIHEAVVESGEASGELVTNTEAAICELA